MDWDHWELQIDEEGRLIVVPTDAPFNPLPEVPWDQTAARADPAEDPEYLRARTARLV